MSEKSLRAVVRAVWDLLRYVTATCVSTLALAVLPIIATLVLTALAGVIVLLSLIGGTMDAGFMAIVVNVPLFFAVLLFGVVSTIAILLLATAFTVVGVLPVSLLTELACQRFSARSIVVRLGSFLMAGLLLGIPAGSAVGLAVSLLEIQTHPLVLLGLAAVLLLTCACAVFLFGLTLTTMTTAKNGSAALWRAVRDFRKRHQ